MTITKRPRKSAGLLAWEHQRDRLIHVVAHLSAALTATKPTQRLPWITRAFTTAGMFPSDDIAERIQKVGSTKRVSVEKLAALRDECAQALAVADAHVSPLLAAHADSVIQYRNQQPIPLPQASPRRA